MLSIVIPVYNMENYIGRTLGNLQSQSEYINDIEVIVVDDKSTDNTTTEVAKYKFPNMKFIKLSHRVSTGECRNIGLKQATKKFICFLDGDALINLGVAFKLCSTMNKEGKNVGISSYQKWDMAKNVVTETSRGLKIYDISEEIALYPLYAKHNLFFTTNAACWNKIYRREFIIENQIKFAPISYGEDYTFTVKSLLSTEEVVYIDKPMILYTLPKSNPNSNDMRSKETWRQIFIAFNDVHSYMKKVLAIYDYTKVLGSFIHSCIGHLRYAKGKLSDEDIVEFNESAFEYLSKIQKEHEELLFNI